MCEHCIKKFRPRGSKAAHLRHVAKMEARFGHKSNNAAVGDPIDSRWIAKTVRSRRLQNRRIPLEQFEKMDE